MSEPKMMTAVLARKAVRPPPPGFAKHLAGKRGMMDDGATLDLPQGFDLQGKGPGDKIQFVVDGEIADDGKVKVEKLNGIPMDGAAPEQSDDEGAEQMPAPEDNEGAMM